LYRQRQIWQLSAEKLAVEKCAAEQAETLRQLTGARVTARAGCCSCMGQIRSGQCGVGISSRARREICGSNCRRSGNYSALRGAWLGLVLCPVALFSADVACLNAPRESGVVWIRRCFFSLCVYKSICYILFLNKLFNIFTDQILCSTVFMQTDSIKCSFRW
jgi:hypothetical protein